MTDDKMIGVLGGQDAAHPIRVPCVLIVGRSGAGKTTLIEGLIDRFREDGLAVGVLKHTSHAVLPDDVGKDTWRFREHQANPVGLLSGDMLTIISRVGRGSEDEGARGYGRRSSLHFLTSWFAGVDLLIIEGMKSARGPKIEVTSSSAMGDLMCLQDPELMAVVGPYKMDAGVPFFYRDDIAGIAGFIRSRLEWLRTYRVEP